MSNIIRNCVLPLIVILFLNSAQTRQLKLVNNGYEGLLVGISDVVPESYCNKVIHGLKIVLSEFSTKLWQATEGRAYLKDVTIALPRSWRTNSLTCSLLQPLETAVPPLMPHISIKGRHPLFGNNPWTQQSQGCGNQGDFIQLGAELLRISSNESRNTLAKDLVNEWVKFRWGVFDENGHEEDPLYPMYFRNPSGNEMRPNRCLGGANSILRFCDSDNHVAAAPNKHNSLCMGRSVWDVIMQSEDFQNDRNKPSNNTLVEPTFHFIQAGAARFVLAVEDTAVMNIQKRWEFVRKAVRRTVVYDVPDDTYMALVVFNSVANTVAPLSKIDSLTDVRQRIGSSLPRNPSTVPESQKCLLCGIQESLRALDSDAGGAAGANIILITSGTSAASEQEMDEIIRLVRTRGIKVIPIIYPMSEQPGISPYTLTKSLDILAHSSMGENGRIYTVVDEGVGNDSKVNMMVSLMDILLAAIRLSCPRDHGGTPVIVHSKAYPGGISSMSTGEFNIDSSLGKNVRFSVYYYDLNHVGNLIQLTTPSGDLMAAGNMQEEDGDANVIFINIPNAQRGLWKYTVENRADSHQGLNIQVTARENSQRKVSINIWTNFNGIPLSIPGSSKPLVIYAEVSDGESPVLGAKVSAKLRRLGTNETGFQYEPIFFTLLDNGAGDPDITKGDGIYSRYLPHIFKYSGHYEMSISADHNNGLARTPSVDKFTRRGRQFGAKSKYNCCGSVLKYQNTKPVAPFRRSMTYGIINVVSPMSGSDSIPPSRILDLRSEVNETTRLVSLTWTAPGDNYDWGTASAYEAVVAPSWLEAKSFEGKKLASLPAPQNAALEQSAIVSITKYGQLSYIAIRAKDLAGNKGGVSNVASVWMPYPPTTESPVTTPSLNLPSSYSAEPLGHSLTQSIRMAGFNLEDIAMIAGSIVGILLVSTFIVAFCYCHVSKKRNMQRRHDSEHVMGNNSIMIKSSSSIMIEDDSRDSADSVAKDGDAIKDGRSLSPVQSWAPSKLLAEHERRFSVSSVPVVEKLGPVTQYGTNLNDPFPDVTLTGGLAYPNSQTPSTTHSDPPAYQPHYVAENYSQYTYMQCQPSFTQEDLPPYTPVISSQSSQASTTYSHDMMQQSEIPFHVETPNVFCSDVPAYISDGSQYIASQPSVYLNPSEQALRPSLGTGSRKVPPPVAPKPLIRPLNYSPNSSEPKRRNVTQV